MCGGDGGEGAIREKTLQREKWHLSTVYFFGFPLMKYLF